MLCSKFNSINLMTYFFLVSKNTVNFIWCLNMTIDIKFVRCISYDFFVLRELSIKLSFSFLRHRWSSPILSILFRPFGFIAPKKLFGFPIFWHWAFLMKFIPVTRWDHNNRFNPDVQYAHVVLILCSMISSERELLVCWYWWNYWPPVLKPFFLLHHQQNVINVKNIRP
jgi:hypothetical protein